VSQQEPAAAVREPRGGPGPTRTALGGRQVFADGLPEVGCCRHDERVVEVLVIEDEVRLARALAERLESAGFSVTVRHDGESGYQRAMEQGADVIVLDLMLPVLSGAEVCARLRAEGVQTPILVLTAREAESDETDVLNMGADDYLRKPFSYAVLLARCRALLRRASEGEPAEIVVGDLVLDPRRRTLRLGETPIELTQREFALLEYLMRHRGRPRTRQEIHDHVWGVDHVADLNVVDVYVGYLRRKVDAPFGQSNVRTVRGQGYMLEGS
jgi:two-component system OmpR family response regulator